MVTNYFRAHYWLGVFLLLPVSVNADEFAEFEKQMMQQSSQQQVEFEKFEGSMDAEYKQYEKELKQAFVSFRRAAARIWGKDKAVIPDDKTMVDYSNDMRQRSVVDLERGKIKVEVAVDPSKGETVEDARQRLKKLIAKTLTAPADTRPITELVKKPEPPKPSKNKPAALANQVQDNKGRTVTKSNVDEFANSVMQGTRVSKTQGTDKVARTVVSVEIPLVPDHIKKRAVRYQTDVERYANKYHVDKEVVFAVMETESFFNPTAKSAIPAFGLMQLVPHSGARDAYRFVYKKDKIVSERYLYKPQNNIELGTAYLRQVYSTYLSNIDNEESRMWATIAAYNTGAGNVFRTFAGKYSQTKYGSRKAWKAKAAKKINSMTPEQVFRYMKKNLPYQETQNYIVKVRERMPKYQRL